MADDLATTLREQIKGLRPDSPYNPKDCTETWLELRRHLRPYADRAHPEILSLFVRLILRQGYIIVKQTGAWTEARRHIADITVNDAAQWAEDKVYAAFRINVAITHFRCSQARVALSHLKHIGGRRQLHPYWPHTVTLWARMCLEAGYTEEAMRFVGRAYILRNGVENGDLWWARFQAAHDAIEAERWEESLALGLEDLIWP